MKWIDQVSDWALWLMGAIVAGSVWVVRTIFTNQKQIAILQEQHNDTQRISKEIRDALKDETLARRDEVKEMRSLIEYLRRDAS